MTETNALVKSVRDRSFLQRELAEFQEDRARKTGQRFLLWSLPRVVITKDCDFKFPLDSEGTVTEAVVAMRGVLVYFGHGLSLYGSSESGQVCSTIGAKVIDEMGNETIYRSPYPSLRPIRRLDVIENGVSVPTKELQAVRTLGSRGKSCVECVQAQEHILGGGAGEQRRRCSPLTFMVLYVTEVRINDREPVTRNGVRVYVDRPRWVKLTDWQNARGVNLFDKPVLVQMRMASVATTFTTFSEYRGKDQVTRGRYLVTEGYAGPFGETRRRRLAPADVLPWYEFFSQVISKNPDRLHCLNFSIGGEDYSTFIFQPVVEVHAAEIVQTTNGHDTTSPNANCIPTFRVADVSAEYQEQALEMAQEEYRMTLTRLDAAKDSDGDELNFYEPAGLPEGEEDSKSKSEGEISPIEAVEQAMKAKMRR